jgi:transcriptional regulator with XRE-family HTH domain
MSAETLSNIETGRKAPTLEDIAAIAAALGVEVSKLVTRSTRRHLLIAPANEIGRGNAEIRRLSGPEPGPERHHRLSWPLADAFVGKRITPMCMTYAATQPISEVLRPADRLFLDFGAPHIMRSGSPNPDARTNAEVIDVFWTPLAEYCLFGKPLAEEDDALATSPAARTAAAR